MRTVKVLQIGAGRWGKNHLRNWLEIGIDVYLSDLSDAAASRAKDAGLPEEKFSNNFREFFDSVDALDIVTPADNHYALCREAIEAGKDVFIEKPITLTSPEALDLAGRAQDARRIIQVGHIFRFDPATDWIKAAIAKGTIGKPRWMEARFLGFKRPRADSGVSFADSLHFIDLFNYLLGRLPRAVNASFADVLGRGMEDSSIISLDYEDAFASVQANYFMPGKERTVALYGDEASIVCDYAAGDGKVKLYKNRHYREDGSWKAQEGEVIIPDIPAGENLKLELEEFLTCIAERTRPRADARDGYNVVKVLEAAVTSAREGKTINLEN